MRHSEKNGNLVTACCAAKAHTRCMGDGEFVHRVDASRVGKLSLYFGEMEKQEMRKNSERKIAPCGARNFVGILYHTDLVAFLFQDGSDLHLITFSSYTGSNRLPVPYHTKWQRVWMARNFVLWCLSISKPMVKAGVYIKPNETILILRSNTAHTVSIFHHTCPLSLAHMITKEKNIPRTSGTNEMCSKDSRYLELSINDT